MFGNFELSKVADLSLSTPTVTPATVSPGGAFRVLYVIGNAGPDPATNVVLIANLPVGLEFDINNSHPNYTPDGGSVTCRGIPLSQSFNVAYRVPLGFRCPTVIGYQASVHADEQDPTPENNERSAGIPCVPPFPNLVTENFTITGNLVSGARLTLRAIVRNVSSVAAVSTVTVFRVDGSRISHFYTGPLAPNATEQETAFWTARSGTHVIEVCADGYNYITESNEQDNCSRQTVTIR